MYFLAFDTFLFYVVNIENLETIIMAFSDKVLNSGQTKI